MEDSRRTVPFRRLGFAAKRFRAAASLPMESLHQGGLFRRDLLWRWDIGRTLLCRVLSRAEKGIWRASFRGRFFQSPGREFRWPGCEVGLGTVGENGSFFESTQKRDADKRLFPGGTRAVCRLEVRAQRKSGGHLFMKVFPKVWGGVLGTGVRVGLRRMLLVCRFSADGSFAPRGPFRWGWVP